MYLIKTLEGNEARAEAQQSAPFGPGFPSDAVAHATKMEVWGTNFSDPGPDYCEFRLFGPENQPLGTRRVDGY